MSIAAGVELLNAATSAVVLWAWAWNLLPLGILMCIGFTMFLTVYFWPLSSRDGDHVGGRWVHPRVELAPDERVDARFRASVVRSPHGKDNEGGWLAVTSQRAIFVPALFPWVSKEPTTIRFDLIKALVRDRLPAPTELGRFGGLLRVRGLRVDTTSGSLWFGKPNTEKIERALRAHIGL